MRTLYAGLAALMLASVAPASIIVTSSTICTLGDQVVSSPSECGNNFMHAYTSSMVDLEEGQQFWSSPLVLSVSADASTSLDPAPGFESAEASIIMTATFYTDGPIRMGFANAFASSDGVWGYGGASGFVKINGVPVAHQPAFPFELGVPFTVTLRADASTSHVFGGGGWTSRLGLVLTDFDGHIVQVLDAPEPTASSLLAIGLLAIFLSRHWWTQQQQRSAPIVIPAK
jgi:hypothetical protein